MDTHIDINTWLSSERFSPDTHPLIYHACVLAQVTGEDLQTPHGKSCFLQGLETASILARLEFDAQTIASAIIYSTAEHSDLPIEDIANQLGEPVAHLVQHVQQMNLMQHIEQQISKQNVQQINHFRKMLLTMVRDVRAVVIKLADILATLRSIKHIDIADKEHLAHCTMEIFAPLANRLGLHQLKQELEDLSFSYLDHDMYRHIAKKLAESKSKRDLRVKRIVALLEKTLKDAYIPAKIYGRAKHIYSIKRKMTRKNVDLDQIYDATAVRILVNSIKDCYKTLSIAHEIWEPIPEEFDDYIANPKPNGYQSIHTAVADTDGHAFEIQIRTKKMHDKAEKGLAAHWMYKEGKPEAQHYEEKIAWLRQLLEWQKTLLHDHALPKALEKVVFEERVYAFTPAGDIIDLPSGSTPLDFAYHIHSEVGHRCRGAKVNGKITPLTQALQTGDKVEVITTKMSSPSRDWLSAQRGYLKTSAARAKVLQWFKKQDYQSLIAAGRNTLERELSKLSIGHQNLEAIAKTLNYPDTEHFLAAIGGGNLKISRVISRIHDKIEPILPDKPPKKTGAIKGSPDKNPIRISGIGNLLARIGRCCKPVPGDPIVGYITQGHGITAHHADCKTLLHQTQEHPERLIHVHWNDRQKTTYPVDIEILAYHSPTLIQDITTTLVQEHINIIDINSHISRVENTGKIIVTIEIDCLELLSKLLERLQQITNVQQVTRI